MVGSRDNLILSEVRQTKTTYDSTCMWHLKYDTDELIHKPETDSLTEDRAVGARQGAREGWSGVLG